VSVASEMIKLGFSPKYIFVLQPENSLTSDSPGKYLFYRSCKINNKKYKNCSFTQPNQSIHNEIDRRVKGVESLQQTLIF